MNNFKKTLSGGAIELGITLESDQLVLLEKYYRMVIETNKSINLTAITDEREFIVKHLIDSLTCLYAIYIKKGARVLDVGTGAGFPGIPLAVGRPDLLLTMVEATEKKVRFLEEVVQELALRNVKILHTRAEDFGRKKAYREKYDIVVSRAVAPLAVLAEYCLPPLRTNGVFISMKGPNTKEEVVAAQNALAVLGGVIKDTIVIRLPYLGDERKLIIISKVRSTPDTYPRRAGIPAKKPL
ncbi:MAG: 16S rRNA (guanine(527)-N(7))-methyltransferase RsmG [Peptococcaceae bacterium]|nr:16S rRNA (guanine(527)-N(7))-methyltransferase RsmG [Candidatus Syntrophopropionicum ammoniitolerans]